MKINILTLSLGILLVSLSGFAYGQEDCSDKLQKAETLYDQGQFSEVIQIAKSCLDYVQLSEGDNTIKWKSYRLLAMTYLATNDLLKAREAAFNMLELNPRYKPSNLKDPVELVKLIRGITIIPRFSFGLAIALGSNYTFPTVTRSFFVAQSDKKYTGLRSYQFGISTSYQVNAKLAVEISALASEKKYEITYPTSDWALKMEEKLTYLNFPVYLRYIPAMKTRIRPYVQAGGYMGALILTDNSFYATKKGQESYSLEHIQSKERRNNIDAGVIGGLGAFYKLGDGHLSLQVNYFHSFQNITNADLRYAYNDLFYNYFYLDDDIKLSNLYFSIGYNVHLNYKVIRD